MLCGDENSLYCGCGDWSTNLYMWQKCTEVNTHTHAQT